jgi:hypothetical protein
MAKSFRPQVNFKIPFDYKGDFRNHIVGGSVHLELKNYIEVKKRMKEFLIASENYEVNVYRHRRGQWGEWVERWSLINDKPQITFQTWN